MNTINSLRCVLLCAAIGLMTGCSKRDGGQAAAPAATKPPAANEGPQLTVPENAATTATASTEADGAASAAPAADTSAEPASSESDATTESAAEVDEAKQVTLGDASLTGGIPGSGPLTVADVQKWLDDPQNHEVIPPLLPLGLSAASSQVVGVDTNPLTRAKIELGRQLYFDGRLSKDGTISCASCHAPEFGYAKNTQFGVGVGGQTGGRNSPVAYNRILSAVQFWDGRAATLEAQAVGPIANPIEMSNTHEACVATIAGIEGYRIQFEKVFPDGATIDNVAKAIASFERSLVTGPSPWDYYEQLRNFEKAYAADLEDLDALQQDDPDVFAEYQQLKAAADAQPLSESARRGGELFFSERVGCTACHVGANFTDELYHNLGVGMDAAEPDVGRFAVTKEEKDRGAFKTPTVRNVAMTAPYMHDGSQKTLEEVVEWYNKGGHPNPNLDEKIKKLDLTDQEKADLVEFMNALTGELPKPAADRLPE